MVQEDALCLRSLRGAGRLLVRAKVYAQVLAMGIVPPDSIQAIWGDDAATNEEMSRSHARGETCSKNIR